MRNAQLKPGYNIQIAVDSEYIVATDIFQDRNDVWTLVPFLKRMEEKLGFRYPSVTADSGYESEEGYSYLREQKQKPYIKPQTYEKWKKRSFKKDISKRENMGYDERTDTYTCHAGKKLQPIFLKKQTSKSGYESKVTVYECEDCTGCPYKEKCTKAKGNKRLYVSKNFLEKRQESYENILSEEGILYRMNRSIQVEGAFGVLKNDYEFQRFLLRGKTKVKLEILLLSMGYNLNKLHAKIQNDRTGKHFIFCEKTCLKIEKTNIFIKVRQKNGSQPQYRWDYFRFSFRLSEGVALSSNLIILRHPLILCSFLYVKISFSRERAIK